MSVSTQTQANPSQRDENPDWKLQLAERLDAYRAKHAEHASPSHSTSNGFSDSRASKIAQSVASRYAAAPKYSDVLLAAELERAEAEARAVQEQFARQQLLQQQIDREEMAAAERQAGAAELLSQDEGQPSPAAGGSLGSHDGSQSPDQRPSNSAPRQPGIPVMPQFAARSGEMHLHRAAPEPEPSLEDLWNSALVEPRSLLPSKLIEFPRELVSSRRARPRLPENPERSSSVSSDSNGSSASNGTKDAAGAIEEGNPAQLRIFEVEPEQASAASAAVPDISALAPPAEPEASSQTVESAGAPPSDGTAPKSSPESLPNIPRSTIPHSGAAVGAGNAQRIPPRSGKGPSASNGAQPAKPLVPTAAQRARTAVQMPPRAAVPDKLSGVRDVSRGNATPLRAFKTLEWAAISLDKEPAAPSRRPETRAVDYIPFLVDPAPIDRRLMAFAVDFAAVTAAFLTFLLVFAASTPHLPSGATAIALGGAVYASLWVLYQMLFFSLSGATAGMMYARIALCTFDDQNPTRPALRRRLAAWWLSCLPVGLGFLWCFVDEDNLSWHDRMTRMYQRAY